VRGQAAKPAPAASLGPPLYVYVLLPVQHESHGGPHATPKMSAFQKPSRLVGAIDAEQTVREHPGNTSFLQWGYCSASGSAAAFARAKRSVCVTYPRRPGWSRTRRPSRWRSGHMARGWFSQSWARRCGCRRCSTHHREAQAPAAIRES
jgi:hypothetical protein